MFILQAQEKVEVFKTITEAATKESFSNSFANAGQGIGAVFLMIVAIYYISSILDGGKFQLKMLVPFLIFIFVCNFSWVSKPVGSFISHISTAVNTGCSNANSSMLEGIKAKATDRITDVAANDAGSSDGKTKDARAQMLDPDKKLDTDDSDDGRQMEKNSKRREGLIVRSVKKGVSAAGATANASLQKELDTDQGKDLEDYPQSATKTVLDIVGFICDVFKIVLQTLGSTMAGIIMAFGPITWAFAIIPGQGNTIKSWFLRLCQFSLYGPIVALINSLAVKTVCTFSTANMNSLLAGIAQGLALIAALTSVPSIASMIIEGASGAVSLSSGLQAASSAATVSGSILGAGGKAAGAVIGKDKLQGIKDGLSGMASMGVGGVAKAAGRSGMKGMFDVAKRLGKQSRLGNR